MPVGLTNLAIELTERETALVSRIDFGRKGRQHRADSWRPIADAMLELMTSLLERNAIPVARWRFFTDAECFIGGHGLSHLQTFEKHGKQGADVFRDGNFVQHLRYFLYGPDLPKLVIKDFQGKIEDCGEPFNGTDALAVADFARKLTRSRRLHAHRAAEEFYKLALEWGLDPGDARSVRDFVKRVR